MAERVTGLLKDMTSRRRRSAAEGADGAPNEREPALALPEVPAEEEPERAIAAHPFWSEKARAEQELQLLRPQSLDDVVGAANVTSTAGSSTELRPGSTGVDRSATGTAPHEVAN